MSVQDAPTKKKTGRPTTFSERKAKRICEHVASGGSIKSLIEAEPWICHNISDVWTWSRAHPSFSAALDLARKDQARAFVDEIPDIAEQEPDVSRAKLAIGSRQWLAARELPEKYSETTRQEVSGPRGGPIRLEQLTDADLDALERIQRRLSGIPDPVVIDVTPKKGPQG